MAGIWPGAVHQGGTKLGWSDIHVGTRQDIVPLEQRSWTGRVCHNSSDQISFKDRMEWSLFGLGIYPVDTRRSIGRALNRKARERSGTPRRNRIPRSSDEICPPI